MSKKLFGGVGIGIAAVLVLMVAIAIVPPVARAAATTGEQILLRMKFITDGVGSKGAGVLQTGEVNTLSAAVASATRAQVVAAPASGSIYLRAIFVEQAATAASASTYTVTYGTGTNCGTGTTTLFGPVGPPAIGYTRVDILVPATKALCLATDAATTTVRALTN